MNAANTNPIYVIDGGAGLSQPANPTGNFRRRIKVSKRSRKTEAEFPREKIWVSENSLFVGDHSTRDFCLLFHALRSAGKHFLRETSRFWNFRKKDRRASVGNRSVRNQLVFNQRSISTLDDGWRLLWENIVDSLMIVKEFSAPKTNQK